MEEKNRKGSARAKREKYGPGSPILTDQVDSTDGMAGLLDSAVVGEGLAKKGKIFAAQHMLNTVNNSSNFVRNGPGEGDHSGVKPKARARFHFDSQSENERMRES